MNYEQKYKEAVRRVKVFYEMTESVADKEWLSNVFPELTENDDEGIRKEIIRMIKYFHEKAHHFIYRYPVKDMLAWVEKQGKKESTEWSKEDEKKLDELYKIIYRVDYCEKREELGNWLYSLKDRIVPQSNREWNEEDEKIVKAIIAQIDDLGWPIKDKEKDMYVSWLKSLKPQNQWKPTSEQMKAFHTILRLAEGETYRTALSLYDDLKKLA